MGLKVTKVHAVFAQIWKLFLQAPAFLQEKWNKGTDLLSLHVKFQKCIKIFMQIDLMQITKHAPPPPNNQQL